jgi:hypothetical protein
MVLGAGGYSPAKADSQQFTVNGMAAVFHAGGPKNLVTNGITPIDHPTQITCASAAGCVLTSTAYFTFPSFEGTASAAFYKICFYLDGNREKPDCLLQDNRWPTASVSDPDISQGTHTVQTKVVLENEFGAVTRWQLNYIMYDR